MRLNNRAKQYGRTNFMVYSCQYHIIFCPKYRRPVLVGRVAKRFKELAYEKARDVGFEILEMEVIPDHVHLLLNVSPGIRVHRAVSLIKGYTSYYLRKEFRELRSRLPTLWTRSKFISSCGEVSLGAVKKYIEEQKGQ